MSDESPYLVQLGAAQTDVVRALFEGLPGGAWASGTVDSFPRGGWVNCIVEYRQTGRVGESRVDLTGSACACCRPSVPGPLDRVAYVSVQMVKFVGA